MKFLGSLLVGVAFLGAALFVGAYDKKIEIPSIGMSMPASVFFTQSTSSSELRTTFNEASSTQNKLNVLIVPGHEPGFGGAEYRDIKERDLNADLSQYLAQYLIEDGHYNVVITRGSNGWNPVIQEYFDSHPEEIKTFTRSQKMEMARLVDEGRVVIKGDNLPHNDAPSDVALRLYGINKWANENNIDIIIHVHFNDSSPRRVDMPGEYNGFTIYTPEHQYSNAKATAEIAPSIFKRLSKMFPISNLPVEDRGVVEDQDLIAVGSNNSVDAASMLIEYGYIYEPQFKMPDVRTAVLKELAFQTYLGLSDFFGETSLVVGPYQSTLLPYQGNGPVRKTNSASIEALAFQAALIDKGFYPPEYYTLSECPLSGIVGSCTKAALVAFQKKFGIKGEVGVVGEKTRSQLRSLFQPKLISER